MYDQLNVTGKMFWSLYKFYEEISETGDNENDNDNDNDNDNNNNEFIMVSITSRSGESPLLIGDT